MLPQSEMIEIPAIFIKLLLINLVLSTPAIAHGSLRARAHARAQPSAVSSYL